ncbi:MAG TPA: hypothetical protein VNO30_06330 [Kofleriaceae bacterium]|nr:hypothetical protein [Kofleriaceae bacterium]
MAAPWPRERYVVGGGPGKVALLALSPVRLPDPLPVSIRRHGMPDEGEGATAVSLVARDRADDPAWFTAEVVGRFAELIAQDLSPEAAAAALAAEHAYVITTDLADPDDLGHLQAAWALAKCVCEEGAAVVIDVYAARAHQGSDVAALSPERSFDVMHEVTLFFEELDPEPEPDRRALAAWSLGLCKFGRPDLVLIGIVPDAAAEAALFLRDLAQTLAEGERIEPGDVIGTPAGLEVTVERFAPERWPKIAVDGDALVLRLPADAG